MYQNDACKVLTCEVRLSYANLTQPRKMNENDPNEKAKYSVTLLIPKSDRACFDDVMQSIQAAHNAALNTVWKGAIPQYDSIIHDGDGVRKDGTPYGDECKGNWVLSASSVNKPHVVHQSNLNVELAPQDIYSGMYARVTIRFYGYNNRAKGVACGLGNVMKTRDGMPLSGGASAAADFAGLEQTTLNVGAVPMGGQATPGVMPQQPMTTSQQPMAMPPQGQTLVQYPNYAPAQQPMQQSVSPAEAVQYSTGQYGA